MFDELTPNEKLAQAKKYFRDACIIDSQFQKDAKDDFDFRDGIQWTEQERAILAEELRPCLTFNLIKSSIDLIMGMNEDSRIRYIAKPIEPTDDFLCEILNDLYEIVARRESFEREEDLAFEASTICGRGWVAADFVPDTKRLGDIKVTETVVPVHEIRKDPASRKDDLSDCGYIVWDKWISVINFKIRYPDYNGDIDDLLANNESITAAIAPKSAPDIFEENLDLEDDTSDYTTPLDIDYYDLTRKMVKIVHMEYYENYHRYYGFNPITGQMEEFLPEDLVALKKNTKLLFNQEFEYVRLVDKKVKWLQFNGDQILYDGDSPLPHDGFSIVQCTAYKDVSLRTPNNFGVVRLMKDPQKEVNKRWSQTLNLLNQQVQPGLYAETDAFVDDKQAEESVKEAGSITWLTTGAINQNKFKERTVPAFPQAPVQLEELAQGLLRKITGVNPDLLGMDSGRQEPGVVVRQRQNQGKTILKPLFNGYKNMKRQLFERVVSIIMAFMPDSQIMRILGETDRYVIQDGIVYDKKYEQMADIRDLRNLEYNIASEEVAGNKSSKMLELSIYMEMMQTNFPVDPMLVIEKLDVSATEKKRWIEYISQQQQQAAEASQREYELEMAKLKSTTDSQDLKTNSEAVIKAEKVKKQEEKDLRNYEIEQEKLELEDKKIDLDFIAKTKQQKSNENTKKVEDKVKK